MNVPSVQIAILVTIVLISLIKKAVSEDYDVNEEYDDLQNTNVTINGTLEFTRKLVNVTKDSGTLVRLVCEIQNNDINSTNKVKFRWKHNEVKVEPDGKFKIRNRYKDNIANSTLSISNLEFFDKGMVECIASNGIHRVSSRSFLIINPDPHKYGSTDMNTLRMGINEHDSLDEITTFLPNTIPKLNENPKLIASSNGNSKPFTTSMQFDLTPNGGIVENAPIYNSSEPFCQRYTGRRCKQYLANEYVFVQPPYTQKEIEEKLDDAFLVVSQSNDLSQTCNEFAQPSICFSAFPLCLDHKKINLYQVNHRNELRSGDKSKLKNIKTTLTNFLRRICRDECLLLENELCSKEYSLAKRHVILGKILELEVCEHLPLQHESSSKYCLSLGVGDLNLNRDEKCFWDSGKLYRGNQDTTINGNKCIRWAHQFRILVSDNPELAGHNYCRNPGDMDEEPFCFVEQNKIEKCGISKCVYVFGLYVGAIVFGIALVIIIVVVYWYTRRKNKLARNLQTIGLPQANKNIYGNPGPSSPMEMNTLLPTHNPTQRSSHSSNKNNFQAVPQYTYKEVRFLDELGEGAFGKVYKGELKTKMGKIFVAVKSLKENASAKTQADFQREIELISELKHPNVICLLGIVVKQEPMCMLFEYMSEGDLHEFLIANSPEEGKCLTHDQFLDIAIQIGQGMDYLSGNHYVHRDLAARNCLVSKDLVVKISDFGLSRDMYSCDYYRVQSKSLLPVRWMPPESILYGKFTTESDVWSYGVVLWEIYSYGLQPYYGYNNQEVINMIRSRKLLPCPDACPSYSYALMVECWAEQANRRPNFSEIVHRLKVWKQSGSMTGAYFKGSTTPQRHGHGSKSSQTSGSQTPGNENKPTSLTWERSCHMTNPCRLNDSQSSLTSKSSLGNTTQSTNISSEIRKDKRNRRNIDSLEKPKNIVLTANENGERAELKITL